MWFLIWSFCAKCSKSMDFSLVELNSFDENTEMTNTCVWFCLCDKRTKRLVAYPPQRFCIVLKLVQCNAESVPISLQYSPCYEEFKRQTRERRGGINIMVEFFRTNIRLVQCPLPVLVEVIKWHIVNVMEQVNLCKVTNIQCAQRRTALKLYYYCIRTIVKQQKMSIFKNEKIIGEWFLFKFKSCKSRLCVDVYFE